MSDSNPPPPSKSESSDSSPGTAGSTAPEPPPPRPCCQRRAVTLTLALGLLVAGAWCVLRLHPFLAVTERVPTRFLVVEGWLPDYALQSALAEFHAGRYERVFTTGGPLQRGSHLAAYRTYPAIAAAALTHMGIPTNALAAVEAPESHRNRTFASAVALRDFCVHHQIPLESLNLVSLGAHARRSQLCFQRALGPRVQVGVIAVTNRDYDPDRWWTFSEGVKNVGGEVLGLAYAWLAIDYGD